MSSMMHVVFADDRAHTRFWRRGSRQWHAVARFGCLIDIAMHRRELYPLIEPFDTGFIDLDSGHAMYYEQCGNPTGKPAVFVHGGPGGGGDVNARRFFDPSAYRVVVFDQRGAGRSRPRASLANNTTWHLVADMETLRARLGIERWLVFGGSWGSTLSLAYAQTHAARVSALVLRGIFMLRPKELRWFYQEGASEFFPEQWREFRTPIPADERADLLAAYHRRLTCGDAQTQLAAARAWSLWEAATSSLAPDPQRESDFSAAEFALPFARIEAHFFAHQGFFEREDLLLDSIERIRHIPGVIVQGRYDVVCPPVSAWELAHAWPEADLRIVTDAGHSAYEPGITHELVRATDSFSRN